ncbi:MAG TPA: PilN domain-containing protein [Candidatus Polarisedimenticolaceae bacterium]|nr:PilN domain-containing protein [Candidatus Polarisedimenticolaceae bacterium]
MSARINLAPEVYQTSQRNKRRRRMATVSGIAVASVSGGFVVLMLVLLGAQKIAIASLSNDIKKAQAEISQISDLPKAATAQEHLLSWQSLNQDKPRASKFFEVLQSFVPQGIAVTSVTISESSVLELHATAKNYSLATKFAKALGAANVEIGPNASPSAKPFFTDIQMTSATQDNGVVDFKISTQVASEVTSGN